jgi:hypothetical protein
MTDAAGAKVVRMGRKPRTRWHKKPDPAALDQRTRIARRIRTIENELRGSLRKQGRVVTVHDDMLIGQLSSALVMSEILKGEQSRGVFVDLEQMTRVMNATQRLIAALGLKPELVTGEGPSLSDILEQGEVA